MANKRKVKSKKLHITNTNKNKINIVIHNSSGGKKKSKSSRQRKSGVENPHTYYTGVLSSVQPHIQPAPYPNPSNDEAKSYAKRYLLNDAETNQPSAVKMITNGENDNTHSELTHTPIEHPKTPIKLTNTPSKKHTPIKQKKTPTKRVQLYSFESLIKIKTLKELKQLMKSAMPSIPDETLGKLTNKNKKEAIETFLNQLNGKSPKKTPNKFTDQTAVVASVPAIDQTAYHNNNEDSDDDYEGLSKNVTIRRVRRNIKTNQNKIDKNKEARENLQMEREEVYNKMHNFENQTANSGNSKLFSGNH